MIETLFGVLGFVFVVISFWMLHKKPVFYVLNICGSFCLLNYSLMTNSIWFVFLNLFIMARVAIELVRWTILRDNL